MHTHARTHVDKDMPRRHAVIVLTLLPGQTCPCQCRGSFGPRKGGIENIYLYRLWMLVRTHLSQSKMIILCILISVKVKTHCLVSQHTIFTNPCGCVHWQNFSVTSMWWHFRLAYRWHSGEIPASKWYWPATPSYKSKTTTPNSYCIYILSYYKSQPSLKPTTTQSRSIPQS